MARQIKLVVSLAIAVMVTMAGLSIATGTAAAQGWQDEFDGVPDPDGSGVLVLDENRWTIEDKDRLGQPKFGTPGNIAGQHRGYYVRGNVELPQGTGTLRLRLFQEEDAVEGVISSGALIFTKEKYGYGTYTWSMRMSSTADVPYGDGSPKSGSVSAGFIYEINSVTEIDFEFSGHVLQDNDPSDDETLYMGNWISENNSTFHTVQVPGLNNDFHTYKFIWKEGKITFYVDGVEKATHTTNVPSAPAHFMINHWGTNNPNGFGGEATIGEDQARYFHVDWVEFTPPPAPPPAPSNLTASVKSSGRGNNKIVEKVLLDWQDNSTNEDSFIIERCQVFGKGKNKSCNFVQLDFVGGNSITYSDATVTGRKTYRYRVKAHNDIGDSPFSNVAQAKTP